MTEEEIVLKLVQLENENSNLRKENENIKSSFRQAIETIKSAVKAETQEVERRMTDFLGDRLDEISVQSKANQAEILNVKTELWGDKDRTVGIVNELSGVQRKMNDYDRMHEEWIGVSGSEDKPGAFAMLNRLWLDLRDRTNAGKTRAAILTGGGLTVAFFAFNLITGAIDKASTANAEKAKENEARVTETRKFFFDLDKKSAVTFAEILKDIEALKAKK